MTSDYILNKSIEVGIERIGAAILFGKLLQEYKQQQKDISDVVDTLLMITDIEHITQYARDYKHHILIDTK